MPAGAIASVLICTHASSVSTSVGKVGGEWGASGGRVGGEWGGGGVSVVSAVCTSSECCVY